MKKLSTRNIRSMPCNNPLREMSISYDGKIKYCCNIYFGDNSDIADVKEGIVQTYFSKKSVDFRKEMVKFGGKCGTCGTCVTDDNSTLNTKELRENI